MLIKYIANKFSSKDNGNSFCLPSTDSNGNEIASAEQQLKLWAEFLENKFESLPDEPTVNLNDDFDVDYQMADIILEEVKLCLKHLKCNKAPCPDTI